MPGPTADLPARPEPIDVGQAAPDFTLTDQHKGEWTLSEQLKDGPVVLCFYPMDFSPVCETEMRCVTEELDRLAGLGVQAVGVSCDSFFVHKAWADVLGLTQPLLADMHRAVCRAYGFYFADLNIAARGTVLIGADGLIKWVQSRELGQAMSIDEVISALG